MKAIDTVGLIEFKQKARTFNLADNTRDNKDIAKMKDAINQIVRWLCELEEEKK